MEIVGIGTEIIECVRIAKMIERHGEMFLERVYTPDEVEYCCERASAIQHYAARWAAKEATMKAIAARGHGVRWNEIEIQVDSVGQRLHLRGNAARWSESLGIDELRLSLGGCRTHATAFVIAGRK